MGAGRHPTRRDGAIAIGLLLLPWAVVLATVHRHHLDGGTVGILVAVSLGLATLWVTWAAYRGPEQPGSTNLADVADQLAAAVGIQWEGEASIRRLNDPYPLPISWVAADPALTDPWDSLVKLASSGAGWPPPPPQGTWAAGPGELAGEGGELIEVLSRVPTGRLVVLGEPGTGKTMLMVRLVLDLLARRAKGGPVPILASAASWNPVSEDLRGWLSTKLLIDYPALASAPPPGRPEPTQAAALLASGLILPLLDGLDEIPEQVRGPAISRINDALQPGGKLVATCRTQQYQDAIRPDSGIEVTPRAAVIQLRGLDAEAVRSYLDDDAAGPAAKARWRPLFELLGSKGPADLALSSPLMVGLARAIYNPRPGEQMGSLPDPAELCSPALADQKEVESLLYDAFVSAAYRTDTVGRWKARDAERWLVFLARHLEHTIGSPDFAWWQLQNSTPRSARWLLAGLSGFVAGLLAGDLAVQGQALWAGLGAGFVSAVGAGFAVRRFGTKVPARGMRIRVGRLIVGLLMGCVGGCLVLIVTWIALAFTIWLAIGDENAGNDAGSVAGLAAGLVAVLAFMLARGLVGVRSEFTEVTTPRALLRRDRRAAFMLILTAGLLGGLMGYLVMAVWNRNWIELPIGYGSGHVNQPIGQGAVLKFELAGVLVGGLAAGTGLSMVYTAWPSYVLSRGYLALHQQLPWSFMSFLADAHRRGILRQAGGIYQFRHIELQHRLANRDATEQLGSPVSQHRPRWPERLIDLQDQDVIEGSDLPRKNYDGMEPLGQALGNLDGRYQLDLGSGVTVALHPNRPGFILMHNSRLYDTADDPLQAESSAIAKLASLAQHSRHGTAQNTGDAGPPGS